ncbi:KRI1, partial [Cordylochernes scorpioides]
KSKHKNEVSSEDDEEEDHYLSDVKVPLTNDQRLVEHKNLIGCFVQDDSPDDIKRYINHWLMVKNNDPKLKDPKYAYVMNAALIIPPALALQLGHLVEEQKCPLWREPPEKKEESVDSDWEVDDDDEEEEVSKKNKKSQKVFLHEFHDFMLLELFYDKQWPLPKDGEDEEWKKELYEKLDFDNLDEENQFLFRYFIERPYRENGDEEEEDLGDLSEDERFEEEAAEFERKYNFRYEHPEAGELASIPRKVEDCIVPKESKRKKQREEKKKRKKELLLKKQEEVKRLKALKRKEIEEKFNEIKEASGMDVEMDEDVLEGDFDPEEHDKMMQTPCAATPNMEYKRCSSCIPELGALTGYYQQGQLTPGAKLYFGQKMFNEEYYEVEDDTVPDFAMGENDEELYSADGTEMPRDGNEELPVDEKIDMDPKQKLYTPKIEDIATANQPSTSSGATSKKRKKSYFWEQIGKEKPMYDPSHDNHETGKSFETYLEEYYKLDFEDIVGGAPTRFKYRQVMANDFGLTTEEILLADEDELNKWADFNKIRQRRTDKEEQYDCQAYQKKAMKPGKKEAILKSLYSAEADENSLEEPPKKKRKRENGSGTIHLDCISRIKGTAATCPMVNLQIDIQRWKHKGEVSSYRRVDKL